jgi:hypothetical protein
MANLIPEEPREFGNPDSFESQVREYVRLKDSIKIMESRSKELHKVFMEKLDLDGQEDSDGNLQLPLSFDADGVVRLEKQRRASRHLDETIAEQLIEELGLGVEVYEFVRTIDEEKLMAAYYDGKITEEQLDSMFPVKVTWALWTRK